MTLTEVGRRVQENGSGGTDHGFGQVVLMLGGGVQGGTVHGTWPGLAESDLVDGDLNGLNDYRLVLAEILEKRCGAGSVSQIFPGISQERPGRRPPSLSFPLPPPLLDPDRGGKLPRRADDVRPWHPDAAEPLGAVCG